MGHGKDNPGFSFSPGPKDHFLLVHILPKTNREKNLFCFGAGNREKINALVQRFDLKTAHLDFRWLATTFT